MDYEEWANILKALGHPTRLKIVTGLCKNGCNVSHMVEGLGIPQATVVRDLDFFRSEARKALEENLLHFIVCKVDKTTGHRQIQRSTEDLWEHKYRFVRYLERTEGKQIFLGRG